MINLITHTHTHTHTHTQTHIHIHIHSHTFTHTQQITQVPLFHPFLTFITLPLQLAASEKSREVSQQQLEALQLSQNVLQTELDGNKQRTSDLQTTVKELNKRLKASEKEKVEDFGHVYLFVCVCVC